MKIDTNLKDKVLLEFISEDYYLGIRKDPGFAAIKSFDDLKEFYTLVAIRNSDMPISKASRKELKKHGFKKLKKKGWLEFLWTENIGENDFGDLYEKDYQDFWY